MLSKVLIANRGEIARRIQRTARALGCRTVAVFSDADRDALHVAEADEAVAIGPAEPAESYLAVERLIEAARRTGAEAIHPGYGFLSENADFAAACGDAGLVFIGPSPEVLRLMGHKSAAKERLQAAGVPCVPGTHGRDASPEAFAAAAARLGFPLLVKAAAGGGGRGLRRVDRPEHLASALVSARAEAAIAFGDGDLLLERLLPEARHVEVQIFGDARGQVIHLGERDCSLQRRHQKIIEESPSPAIDADLRTRLTRAAVRTAEEIRYVGAGTVEFLVAGRDFYFLEMNTRLQVEHPVTELRTGLDLVEWQLRVAAGEPLPLAQDQVRFAGHAMEARLYAEDPSADFAPRTGRVALWHPPPGVRVDHALRTGDEIGPFYDPLLAKVIARGADREEARRRLVRALRDTAVLGPMTNRDFLVRVLRHRDFAAGRTTTSWIDRHRTHLDVPAPSTESLALAAVLLSEKDRDPHDGFWAWRNAGPAEWPVVLESGDHRFAARVEKSGDGYRVRISDDSVHLTVLRAGDHRARYRAGGHEGSVLCCLERDRTEGDRVHLDDGAIRCFVDGTVRPRSRQEAADGTVRATMAGRVAAIRCAPGEPVTADQCVAVLEAMKLESRISAGIDGTVAEIRVREGDQVAFRQPLMVVVAG